MSVTNIGDKRQREIDEAFSRAVVPVEIVRKVYDESVAKGFSDEQAFELAMQICFGGW